MFNYIIPIAMAAISFHYIFLGGIQSTPKNLQATKNGTSTLNTSQLFHKNGTMTERGYSFVTTKVLDLKRAKGAFMGMRWFNHLKWKKIDEYFITLGQTSFLIYITDEGYSTSFNIRGVTAEGEKIDLHDIVLFSKSKDLPDQPAFDDNYSSSHESSVGKFVQSSGDGKWQISIKGLEKGAEFSFSLDRPQEGNFVSELVPLGESEGHWLYSERSVGLSCQLEYKLKADEELTKEKNCAASFESIRAMTPFKTYVVTATGLRLGEKKLSFTLRSGMGNSAKQISNSDFLFIGKKSVELEPIIFKFDELNLMNSWSFEGATEGDRSDDEDFEEEDEDESGKKRSKVLFAPKEKFVSRNHKFLVENTRQQVFGHFEGVLYDVDGNEYKFEGVPGYCEVLFLKG